VRPRSVTIPALILLVYGLLLLGFAVAIAVFFTFAASTPGVPAEVRVFIDELGQRELIFGAVQLALGFPMVAAAYGMLRLRPWAWLLGMIICGCNNALLLTEYLNGAEPYLELLLTAMLTLWLNQREVQQAFQQAQHAADPAGLLTAAEDAAAARDAQAQLSRRGG
jgi:hypothetical protein